VLMATFALLLLPGLAWLLLQNRLPRRNA